MKRILLTVMSVLMLAGCSKEYTVSDNPFTMALSAVMSDICYVDIVPESNDFLYYVEAITVDEYSKFSSKSEFVKSIDEKIRKEFEEEYGEGYSFEHIYQCRGAFFEPIYDLKPETEYFIFAYPYAADGKTPLDKVSLIKFKTTKKIVSDITFADPELDGSIITITPSNDEETYYWDYLKKEELEEFYHQPKYFFYYMIQSYIEFGMLDAVLSKGKDTDDILWYYDKMLPGDIFYLVVGGFNNGLTSSLMVYEITIQDEGTPAIVKKIENN